MLSQIKNFPFWSAWLHTWEHWLLEQWCNRSALTVPFDSLHFFISEWLTLVSRVPQDSHTPCLLGFAMPLCETESLQEVILHGALIVENANTERAFEYLTNTLVKPLSLKRLWLVPAESAGTFAVAGFFVMLSLTHTQLL